MKNKITVKKAFRKLGDVVGDAIVGTTQGLTGQTEEKIEARAAKVKVDNKRSFWTDILFAALIIVEFLLVLTELIGTKASNFQFEEFLINNGVVLLIPLLVYGILRVLLPYIITYDE